MNKIQDQEKIKWIMVARTPGVGPITFFNMINLYKDIDKIIENIEKILIQKGKKIYSEIEAKKELELTREYGGDIITYNETNYSKLLSNIYNPPPVLSIKGNIDLLNKKSMAIVGSRNATVNGKEITKSIVKKLTQHDFTITSGLALGIDFIAHNTAVQNNKTTIAVLGSGINVCYPSNNLDLYNNIIKSNNLIVSEFPFNTKAKKENFPRRNRIISGLSYGVIVVEATQGSGSLITANFALEQGREVFAVPGSPLDINSKGTNSLIKDGATIVTSTDDIIESVYNLINYDNNLKSKQFNVDKNIDYNSNDIKKIKDQILSIISHSGNKIDDIITDNNINIDIFYLAVIELEIEGLIYRDFFNNIFLKTNYELF